jgi:hypothetical protein
LRLVSNPDKLAALSASKADEDSPLQRLIRGLMNTHFTSTNSPKADQTVIAATIHLLFPVLSGVLAGTSGPTLLRGTEPALLVLDKLWFAAHRVESVRAHLFAPVVETVMVALEKHPKLEPSPEELLNRYEELDDFLSRLSPDVAVWYFQNDHVGNAFVFCGLGPDHR